MTKDKQLPELRWQLMKVEARLSCPDGGGEWRAGLLRQQHEARTLLGDS